MKKKEFLNRVLPPEGEDKVLEFLNELMLEAERECQMKALIDPIQLQERRN